MANEQQVDRLKKGVYAWNEWRHENPEIRPDLSGAELRQVDLGGINLMGADLSACDLGGANLMGADLSVCDLGGANLSGAYLSEANFFEADLSEAFLSEAYLFEANLSRVNLNGADLQWVYLGQADLSGAYLIGVNLREADLRGAYLIGSNLSDADLSKANLIGADLQGADLRRANLAGANLIGARMLRTNFEDANLTDCSIYGISSWGLNLDGAKQSNLIITPPGEPAIAVDNLEVAQFIYLLLNHKTVRDLMNTLPSKVVLVLGGFAAEERQQVLAGIRDTLRVRGYLPVVFDLQKPADRDITETIYCLAAMARFILADLTDAKSIPQDLQRIIPNLKRVPVQPLLHACAREYAILEHFKRYSWVLEPYRYNSVEQAIAYLEEKAIAPAEAKAKELLGG